jgi:hypothetical protein
MKEVLVSFKHNGYGKVHGIYIMSLEDWKKIKFLQAEGEEIYLYGHAGKHSEEAVSVEKFMLVSKDEDEVETFRKLFGKTFGSYSPFDIAMELYDNITYNEDEEDEDY